MLMSLFIDSFLGANANEALLLEVKCFRPLLGCTCGFILGVRLAGGLNEAEGRVEIYYEGEWGTVCDQGWDINDATVVCHQLGYQQALVIMIEASSFDPGSGPIHLQDVACLGNESNLFVCPTSKNTSACSHNQDAGVICAGTHKYV